MKIKVLYFAQLADLAGKQEEYREIPDASPAGLYKALSREYNFPYAFNEVQVALNHQLSAHAANLNEGDEIAFLPPMTGG